MDGMHWLCPISYEGEDVVAFCWIKFQLHTVKHIFIFAKYFIAHKRDYLSLVNGVHYPRRCRVMVARKERRHDYIRVNDGVNHPLILALRSLLAALISASISSIVHSRSFALRISAA